MHQKENRRECASGRLAMGETEIDSQQEHSTGHRSRLARQAALIAAAEHGETAVRHELIAHLNCLNRRRAHGTQRREGVRRFTCLVRLLYLVATRDVLSYASVTPESSPVESTRVFFLVSTA